MQKQQQRGHHSRNSSSRGRSGSIVVISDLGHSHFLGEVGGPEGVPFGHGVRSTEGFMAPEIITGLLSFGCDEFAFGASLFDSIPTPSKEQEQRL